MASWSPPPPRADALLGHQLEDGARGRMMLGDCAHCKEHKAADVEDLVLYYMPGFKPTFDPIVPVWGRVADHSATNELPDV